MANRLKLSSQFSSEEMKRFIVELQGQYNSLVDEINLKDKTIKDLQTQISKIEIPNIKFPAIDNGAKANELMMIDLKGGVLRTSGRVIGNSDTNVPVNNGTVNTNLNADMLDGKHLGQDSGQINENGADLVASAYVETDANKKFISVAKDSWHNVTTFNNSFTASIAVRYKKDSNGFVHLEGKVSTSASGVNLSIFTLPTGYRPSVEYGFTVARDDSSGLLIITTAGVVSRYNNVGGGWNLFNVIFYAG